jgi:hypothetical protein
VESQRLTLEKKISFFKKDPYEEAMFVIEISEMKLQIEREFK